MNALSEKWKQVILVLLVFLTVVSIGLTITLHDARDQSKDSSLRNTTEITRCTTITEPGKYVLAEDFGDQKSLSASCITIRSSHVVLDGANHTIRGGGVSDSTGILVSHSQRVTNVTIHSVTVIDWNRGIYAKNASDVSIQEVNASHNSEGIAFQNTSQSTVTRSLAKHNLFGVVVDNSSEGIEVEGSQIESNYADDVKRWEHHSPERTNQTTNDRRTQHR
ncbi:right-handed parallel beta-helix repeat-containing protein [Halegenticoccus tardaugens]|uniref:right-handed parallel beta-helix repeat-containing protein n=1 Tax=Halegenticoccus tardaugens TaxID=2071624 RepID=UPI0013E97E60|nr:right-handed parallel beta-helix repeat-containing protein [Halegenticoccus tardaugens]